MRINIISGLVKPGDQALVLISTILKFSALVANTYGLEKNMIILTCSCNNTGRILNTTEISLHPKYKDVIYNACSLLNTSIPDTDSIVGI